MPTVHANGVEICVEVLGDPGLPALLLVAGHGAQLVWWDDQLVEAFAASGFRIVRFDNRDAGLSTHMDGVAPPDPVAILAGDRSAVPYTIEDMADDAASMLDAVGVGAVHALGVSMGGMVAQSLAIRHPRLVASLTSIMSSPDPVVVGTPSPEVIERWREPQPDTRDAVIEAAVESARWTGSVNLGIDECWVRDVAARQFDRAFDPAGVARQFGAIVASPDRRPGLAALDLPALVVHGADDPVITLQGGAATAAAIRGAELLVIDEMRHDLPRSVWPQLVERVATLAGRR